MARNNAILGFVAGMGTGFLRQSEIEEERKRRDKKDARDDELHTARMDEINRGKDERRMLAAAGAPVTVTEGAGGATLPASADERDIGLSDGAMPTPGVRVGDKTFTDRGAADTYAAEQNSPDAINARQVSVLRGIDPVRAQQLESSHTQGKAAKLQLDKAQQELIDEKWNETLSSITSVDQLAGILSGSPMVKGAKVSSVVSEDGKKVQLMREGADGAMVKYGPEMANDQSGVTKALMAYSKLPAHQKITAMMHIQQQEAQRAHQEATLAEQSRHNVVTEGHAADTLKETSALRRATLGHQSAVLAETGRHNRAMEGTAATTANANAAESAERVRKSKEQEAAYAKLPEATRNEVKRLDASILKMDDAITTAQAKNEWDEKSENAKALRVRMTKALEERDRLMAPHRPKDGATPAGGNDYMGFGKGRESAPGSHSSATAAAPKKEENSTAGRIFDAVRRVAGTQVPGTGSGGTGAAAAPAGQPAAVPPTSEGPGRVLDQAKAVAAQATTELQKWGLAQRRADPAGFAAAQQRAQQALAARDAAQRDYESALGPVPASFATQPGVRAGM